MEIYRYDKNGIKNRRTGGYLKVIYNVWIKGRKNTL